jgi:hypothetical protein
MQRIKLTEKQACLVQEIIKEAESFENNDNETRFNTLFKGYTNIIKKYVNEINVLYNKVSVEPVDLTPEELLDIFNKCHGIIKASHNIGMKFEYSLKTLSDEEFSQFGDDLDIEMDNIRMLLSHKADVVLDFVNLYDKAKDNPEEFDAKLVHLNSLGEKYFSDIKTINID